MATPIRSKWPEVSLQGVLGSDWWLEDPGVPVQRGSLIWTYAPYIETIPTELVVDGRHQGDPGNHQQAVVTVRPYEIGFTPPEPKLPVAALPYRKGERYVVRTGKVRPALVLGVEPPGIDKAAARGSANWQRTPTLLVAPYFGVEQDGTRGGWNPDLVDRIQRCTYPQFVWDRLPLSGSGVAGSVLRLDNAFSIAMRSSFSQTDFRLGNEGCEIVGLLFEWLLSGQIASAELRAARELLIVA